jgi:hypothetical protein
MGPHDMKRPVMVIRPGSRLSFAAGFVTLLVMLLVVAAFFAPTASATGTCDNYRPSVVHGYCPVSGTISSGEIIYLFGKAALGNEIGLASSRSWAVSYYRAGQPGKWMTASGTGTYGTLGSSNGTLVDPSCTMTGPNVNANCDVQYIV